MQARQDAMALRRYWGGSVVGTRSNASRTSFSGRCSLNRGSSSFRCSSCSSYSCRKGGEQKVEEGKVS